MRPISILGTLIAVALLISSCGERQEQASTVPQPVAVVQSIPLPVIVPPAPKVGDVLSVDDAEKRIAALQHAREQERASWEQQDAARAAEIRGAKADLAAAEEHQLAVRCFWIAGLLALLAIAAGVAAWFLPILKGRLAAAAVGLGILSAGCYWLGRHAEIIPWIGASVIVGGLAYAIWEIRRGHTATAHAAAFASDMEALIRKGANETDILAAKMKAATAQKSAGIWSLLARIRKA